VGAVKHELEDVTIEKAEDIAEKRYGREFGQLPASQQMQVWMEAEKQAISAMADYNSLNT